METYVFASALCVSRSQYDQAYASFLKWLKHHVAPPLKWVCVGTLTRRFLFSFSTPILDTQADILTVFLPFLVLFLSLLYLVFKSVVGRARVTHSLHLRPHHPRPRCGNRATAPGLEEWRRRDDDP